MRFKIGAIAAVLLLAAVVAARFVTRQGNSPAASETKPIAAGNELAPGLEAATFGNGCFWCTEAVFLRLKGVHSVRSGYSGGFVKNPTYQQVCEKNTGHAEVVQITFDPAVVSYKDLLEVFWHTHDPTTLNRQGGDEGPQYRSVIFTHSDAQKQLAERAKKALDEARLFPAPIVTEIVPFTEFYPAEDYHQNFFANNERHPNCLFVIRPKLEKLREVFREKLK